MNEENTLKEKHGRPEVFRCPYCGYSLCQSGPTLRCEHGHSFDLAKEGYVNLLSRPGGNFYQDKTLFSARRTVYNSGFWNRVLNEILTAASNRGTVLDAGCGEGSLLKFLSAETAIGIDIAKPAAAMTAKLLPGAAVCVGDLRKLPLSDDSVDVVVNMLTPACYGEFRRVLHQTGQLLKIVPQREHLIELRTLIGKDTLEDDSENRLEILKRDFILQSRTRVKYCFPCDETLGKAVYLMTPLTAHHHDDSGKLPENITVDVEVLTACPRG